ncbi:hypothetical protein HY498_01055 [Candidatus Woesearchaeota archaeon]|nr:hypothetical protein [Candidatus Woesearchaeota archaeon]
MEAWRTKLTDDIKSHLETQIKEVARYHNIYNEEKDAQRIQLWLAIANQSKGIFDINLKTKFLERALKEISEVSKNMTEKIESLTKLDIQKEINNNFTAISEINSKLKSLNNIEKDFTALKERVIELTEKTKHIEKINQEIEDIKKVRSGVLEKIKSIESKISSLEKSFTQQNKKIEIIKKSKSISPIKKKKR